MARVNEIGTVEVNVLQLAYLMSELELAVKSNLNPLATDKEFTEDAIERVLYVDQVLQKIKLAIKQ